MHMLQHTSRTRDLHTHWYRIKTKTQSIHATEQPKLLFEALHLPKPRKHITLFCNAVSSNVCELAKSFNPDRVHSCVVVTEVARVFIAADLLPHQASSVCSVTDLVFGITGGVFQKPPYAIFYRGIFSFTMSFS